MTNQNPASSNPQSTKLSQEILSKVNAHADRSIDRLFADIDELLSGDLSGDIPFSDGRSPSNGSTPNNNYIGADRQQYRYPAETNRSAPPRMSDVQTQQPQSQYRQYQPPTEVTPPSQPVAPQQTQPSQPKSQKHKNGSPLWMKAFLGIGIVSIALSSLLLWLINERKISLPKNIDTSWLPFQSSQISADDAKFAEYMRKSIAKIESANTQTSSSTAPTNAATNPTSVGSPIPITPGIITTTPNSANSNTASISLTKTLPTGDRPGAIFEINSQTQTVYAGEKIGTSDWSLLTVAKGEVIVKKTGGVIRSIYVGQKF
jgi:hypothetical protein